MSNKCRIIFSVAGPPDILQRFCLATISPEFERAERSCNLYFSLGALVPRSPNQDSWEVWGCGSDVYGNITLSDMGWHPGCDSLSFFFETGNAPPTLWFYKVVKLYPALEFHLSGDIFTFGYHMDAHGLGGLVVSENIKRGVDYFGYSELESESDSESESELESELESEPDSEPESDSPPEQSPISYYDEYYDASNTDPY